MILAAESGRAQPFDPWPCPVGECVVVAVADPRGHESLEVLLVEHGDVVE